MKGKKDTSLEALLSEITSQWDNDPNCPNIRNYVGEKQWAVIKEEITNAIKVILGKEGLEPGELFKIDQDTKATVIEIGNTLLQDKLSLHYPENNLQLLADTAESVSPILFHAPVNLGDGDFSPATPAPAPSKAPSPNPSPYPSPYPTPNASNAPSPYPPPYPAPKASPTSYNTRSDPWPWVNQPPAPSKEEFNPLDPYDRDLELAIRMSLAEENVAEGISTHIPFSRADDDYLEYTATGLVDYLKKKHPTALLKGDSDYQLELIAKYTLDFVGNDVRGEDDLQRLAIAFNGIAELMKAEIGIEISGAVNLLLDILLPDEEMRDDINEMEPEFLEFALTSILELVKGFGFDNAKAVQGEYLETIKQSYNEQQRKNVSRRDGLSKSKGSLEPSSPPPLEAIPDFPTSEQVAKRLKIETLENSGEEGKSPKTREELMKKWDKPGCSPSPQL